MYDRLHALLHEHFISSAVVIEGAVLGGTAVTMTLWHISASDMSVAISAVASLTALAIQFWVAREKVKVMRKLLENEKASQSVDD